MTDETEKSEVKPDDNPQPSGHMPPPPLQHGVILPGADNEDYYSRKKSKVGDFLFGFFGNFFMVAIIIIIFQGGYSSFSIIPAEIIAIVMAFKKGPRFIGWGIIYSIGAVVLIALLAISFCHL